VSGQRTTRDIYAGRANVEHMDGATLIERVETDADTELRRLGSDKYLLAATGADLSPAPVVRSVARTAASGRETFAAWAEAGEGEAAAAFAAAADEEGDHYDRIVAELAAITGSEERPEPADDAVADALAAAERAPERVGAGLVGRSLVADRTLLQAVNFFVNEGDEARADLFREFRGVASDRLDGSAAVIDAVCTDDGEYERARTAAVTVIEAAYEEYAAALEEMGLDPKPVC